jgi:hypothetical protein
MARAPDWTEAEFISLLSRPNATQAELRDLLPGRSDDAIALVRTAIHDFHTRESSALLSQLMIRTLEEPVSAWRCPVCQQPLRPET